MNAIVELLQQSKIKAELQKDATWVSHLTRIDRLVFFAAVAGAIYLSGQAVKLLYQWNFPDKSPGEENTLVLATYLPRDTPTTVKEFEGAKEYDYIIVGTGTAGAVLANRLSADPSVKVLAIEAGFSDRKQQFSEIPAAFTKIYKTATDWAFHSKPQEGTGGRRMYWPQGKMLGGCSSINAMIYNRGAPDDYDEWERLGNAGWGFKDVEPFMKKAEGFTQNPDHPVSDAELLQHGTDGPWSIGYSWFNPISQSFIDACAGVGFRKVRDLNSNQGTNGVSRYQTHINPEGQRASTARCYLTEQVTARKNLKIAVGQTVTRIIFDESGSRPRAIGVEMATDANATVKYIARAEREVILSAGAVKTPQILKNSGVGSEKELRQHGIKLVKEMPAVGANLVDHLLAPVVSKVPEKASLHYLSLGPLKTWREIIEWKRFGTGPLTTNMVQSAAFCRVASRPDAPVHLRQQDLSSGPNGSDIEILGCPVVFVDHGFHQAPVGDYFSVATVLLKPSSRGTVTLASADPFADPIIDPQYLSTQHDVDMLLYGTKLCRRILQQDAFAPQFRGWYLPAGFEDLPDKAIIQHIRDTSDSLYHPMCTARMGRSEADSVVDTTLRVHGITGLRIVDASSFPAPVAVHPCAPVVMLAERAADLIGKGM